MFEKKEDFLSFFRLFIDTVELKQSNIHLIPIGTLAVDFFPFYAKHRSYLCLYNIIYYVFANKMTYSFGRRMSTNINSMFTCVCDCIIFANEKCIEVILKMYILLVLVRTHTHTYTRVVRFVCFIHLYLHGSFFFFFCFFSFHFEIHRVFFHRCRRRCRRRTTTKLY